MPLHQTAKPANRPGRRQLDRFINHTATELTVGLLIILSIVLTVMEVKAGTGNPRGELYELLGHIITGIFIVELSIRWYVARSTGRFFRQYWIDVIAVIPIIRPLRILRVLRLLRLVRLGILVTRRTRKVANILSEGLAENMIIVVILLVVFLIGSIGITLAERSNPQFQSFTQAVWWSLYTLMAGEPIGGEASTVLGKIITMVLMLGGFTIFAMFTGVVSAVMVDRLRGGMEAKEFEMDDLRGHFVICGWNRSALTIIRELQAARRTRHRPIVIIAELAEEPSLPSTGINRGLLFFVRDDYTSTEVLRAARVPFARGAILLADQALDRSDQDRDARTILAALTIEKLAKERTTDGSPPDIYSCVELLDRSAEKVRLLEMAGVEDIVDDDEYVGHLIAHSPRAYGLVQVLNELLTAAWGCQFWGDRLPRDMTFEEALTYFKEERDELVVGVIDGANSSRYQVNPPLTQQLERGQRVLVIEPPEDRDASPIGGMTIYRTALPPAAQAGRPSELAELSDHTVICGYARSTLRVVNELRQCEQTRHLPLVVVAELPEPPAELKPLLDAPDCFYIHGDYTVTDALEKARIPTARTAILLADKSRSRSDQDRDARTILAALTIEKMNPLIHTCAQLLNRDGEKVQVLRMAKVEDVVVGDEYVGNLIAHSTRAFGLVRMLDELMATGRGNEFFKVDLPAELVGMPFGKALTAYKQQHDGLIFAVETAERPPFGELPIMPPLDGGDYRYYICNPPADYLLSKGDNLFIITGRLDQPEVLA